MIDLGNRSANSITLAASRAQHRPTVSCALRHGRWRQGDLQDQAGRRSGCLLAHVGQGRRGLSGRGRAEAVLATARHLQRCRILLGWQSGDELPLLRSLLGLARSAKSFAFAVGQSTIKESKEGS